MEHLQNRPLKIVHGFDRHPERDMSADLSAITNKLEELRGKGFGGVVSNVSAHDYLRGEDEWTLLEFVADECERLGLRFWLYDEDGYPSGAAGGRTLEKNPDFEAVGVVLIRKAVAPGESVCLPLPRGHMYFLCAALYPAEKDGDTDISDFTPLCRPACHGQTADLCVTNPSDAPAVLCAFAQKRLYEGTHAEHNVFRARRYVDLTNPDAVAEFLRNTYAAYCTRLPEHLPENGADTVGGIGKIEAIFTDEPSMMGCYINAGLYPPVTQDPYDDSLPLYPVITWGRDYEAAFLADHGYSALDDLIYRFCGTGERAKTYRANAHATLCGMYERAYFAQISAFCRQNGLRFSGHLLLEDDIRMHAVFEGNFFSLLRHMDYPGIDMLQSIPEVIYNEYAFTPLLVSSVAEAYGRRHVMSEVSGHAQGGRITPAQQYASVLLQYAFGVDIFTYYYSENAMEPAAYAAQNAAIARVGAAMAGRTHRDALLYYPIETFFMHHCGSDAQYGTYTEAENACAAGLKALTDGLNARQIGFAYADEALLSEAAIADGCIRLPAGATYKTLLLPPMERTPRTDAFLARCRAAGVQVLALTHPLFPAPADAHTDTDAAALLACIDRTALPAYAAEPIPELALLCRNTDAGQAFLLVNARNEERELTLTFPGLANPTVYDPLADAAVPHTARDRALTFRIPAYGALMIADRTDFS